METPSSTGQIRTLLSEKAVWGYLIVTLVLGFAYSAINPIHEGTDELRHYRFVQYIIQNKSLPVQGEESCRSQSHHPPLFYLMASAVSFWVDTGQAVCHAPQDNPFWGYRQWEVGTDNKNLYLHQPAEDLWVSGKGSGESLAAHLARGVNVLLGGLAVVITWLTARVIWPNNRWMAFGAVPLVAFLPQFLYMSGTLNNDVIAAVAGGLVCLVGVLLINRPGPLTNPVKWGMIFGAVYTLALMSKFNLAPFGLPLGLVIIYKTLWQTSHRPFQLSYAERAFFTAGFTFVGTTAVLAGWWFLRNQLLYGEPTGFRILTELWGVREASSSWGLLWIELPGIWSSFVGRFGYGQIPLPSPFYQLSWGMTVFAIFGICLYPFWVGLNKQQMSAEHVALKSKTPHLLLLGLVAAIAIIVVFAYVLVSPAGAMGRFLFPGLSAFALLIFWGLTRWPILFGHNFDRPLAIGLNVIMLFVGVWALFGYLQPAYARPEILTAEQAVGRLDPSAQEPIFFEPFVHLTSYQVSKRVYTPGEKIDIYTTWNVTEKPFGDFYFFVHLIDRETGELIAQRDTQPGTGKFPMSLWNTGDIFHDHIAIQIPETAHPGSADVKIGFYAPIEQYRLAVSDGEGNGLGDSFTIAPVDLLERTGDYPNSQNWNFEGRARLRGFEYNKRVIMSGESLELTFYWDLLDKSQLKHTDIMVVLSNEQGQTHQVVKPFSDLFSGRHQGGTAIGTYTIDFETLNSANFHEVSLILIDQFTAERVNMVTSRGNWIDDEIFLPSVQLKIKN